MASPIGLDRPHLNLPTIQHLTRFSFVPRRRVGGPYSGRHPSPQRGQSVEFRDYRQYLPGDDASQVDWKVYGRSDKLYVRLFEHETQLSVTLLVDASGSMAYGDRPHGRKYDHACRLAAAIALVIIQAQDRVGFALARDGLLDYQRPSAALAQLARIVDADEHQQPRDTGQLAGALERLPGQLQRGEIVVVFSDLWEDLDELFRSVARIQHVGAEMILFHVLHPDELELPVWGDLVLFDSETTARLRVNVDEVRADYRQRLDRHLESIRTGCRRFEVQYQLAPLSEPFQQTLERFLVRRCTA
jgi:uncharacterized protein (DUF58 family)